MLYYALGFYFFVRSANMLTMCIDITHLCCKCLQFKIPIAHMEFIYIHFSTGKYRFIRILHFHEIFRCLPHKIER